MSDHLVVRLVSRLVIPLILLFALYVQFHGDFGPGGGFQAGVIFGAGLILYALLYGLAAAQKVISLKLAKQLSSWGVLLYTGVGILTLLMGGNFLEYSELADDNVLGQHIGIVAIELGVGITVAAVMLVLFYTFVGYRPADERYSDYSQLDDENYVLDYSVLVETQKTD